MKYLILFLFSTTLMAQAPLKKPNRALDQDSELCVNDGGVTKCLTIDGPTADITTPSNFNVPPASSSHIGRAAYINPESVNANPVLYFGHDNFVSEVNNFITVNRTTEQMEMYVAGGTRMTVANGYIEMPGAIQSGSSGWTTGTILTIGSQTTYMFTIQPRNYGGGDNRGGTFFVSRYSSSHCPVTTIQSNVCVLICTASTGAITATCGGGAPVNAIRWLKLM